MANDRRAARAAVAAWFAPPAVAGLNYVFRAFPKNITNRQYFAGQPAGTRSGAVGIVHIVNSKREQKEIQGVAPGGKRVDYECELQLLMKSTEPTAEAATDAFDALIDAVIVRLESDRTLGGTVWQAGVAMLETETAEPHLTPTLTELWTAIRFDLAQWT